MILILFDMYYIFLVYLSSAKTTNKDTLTAFE